MSLRIRSTIIVATTLFLQFASFDYANPAQKSRDYKIGYNWVLNSDVYTLLENGINRSFNIQGNPVRFKAEAWCYNRSFRIIYSNKRSEKEWTQGCTAAVMKLKLSQLIPSDY